jgi:DNA repair protein RecO (recombination protein O)
MIQWDDEAIILSARAHGEKAAIVTVLASEQGRHAGLVAGGQGRSAHGVLQQGTCVQAHWQARLPEHLGHFKLESTGAGAARWLSMPVVLATICSACVVTEQAVPERQPLPAVYDGLRHLLALEDADLFGAAYVQWELGLLAALGYGLDLSSCAVTQQTDELVYVSPRSGRAVSRAAGAIYHDKLLHLPLFLRGEPDWSPAEIIRGLQLTGHFLARRVFHHTAPRLTQNWHECLPAARRRLAALYEDTAGVVAQVA